MTPIVSLERFARAARAARAGLCCEVCGLPLAAEHRHVVDKTARRLLCACQGCVIAFDGDQPARFRTVPLSVRAASVMDAELAALGVPVGLAFFFRSSSLGRWVALFPSVAGATEAELPNEAAAVLDRHELLDDVEALLVRSVRGRPTTSFIVPVDAGYELTALLRKHWRGIDGGDEVRAALDTFFANVAARQEAA